MKTPKHTTVFPNVGRGRQSVYIATLEKDQLGERVSPIVLRDFCGDLRAAVRAYDEGKPDEGERIICNLP